MISSYTGTLVQTIPLPQDFVSKFRLVRWSPQSGQRKGESEEQGNEGSRWQSSRILIAVNDMVRIHDITDVKWSAVVERAASNFGRIADVKFGPSPNEILVFSDFGVKLTTWSLVTCRGVEFRDPKYIVHCYSCRSRTGHLAIITRPAAQDILMLLNPRSHELITSLELPTIDAQEVLWSPNGCWLAIRDAASSGHKLLIYTADAHLFKTYTGVGDTDDIGLGIKSMAWSCSNGTLALGDCNDNVTILSNNTVVTLLRLAQCSMLTPLQFSPVASFHHPSSIQLPEVDIWQEQLNASKSRTYAIAPQPASPPSSTVGAKASGPIHGISTMSFSGDGTLLATKNDSIPTTVWIWSLQSGRPVAVLIHHSPVKQISWHPQQSDLLLIHCAIPDPAIHLWKSTWSAPMIITLPLSNTGGRLEAHWLRSLDLDSYNILLTSTHSYITAQISQTGSLIPSADALSSDPDLGFRSVGTGAEDMFDEGNSLDLSPIKIAHDETMEVHDGFDDGGDGSGSSGFGLGNEMVDDTFHYRRHIKAGV